MKTRIPDQVFNAYVDGRLGVKAERDVMHALEKDAAGAARVAAWRRQSDALRAALSPIADEPLPLSIVLKIRASVPDGAANPVVIGVMLGFLAGLVCGFGLNWIVIH
jgi:anti-sigma factor RsiW